MSRIEKNKKVTVQTILKKKGKEKVADLTAYDAFTAQLLDEAGIDILLVGDSAANVLHGYEDTLPIGMEVMVAHTAAVSRGTDRALVVADMPFMSYQPSVETAVRNAGRFLAEGGARAVKIEGGLEMVPTIVRVIECGIPVMAHIGLTPQSIHRIGGPKVQGKNIKSRAYLLESAQALEEAGCFSMVLELMQSDVAEEITGKLKSCVTIGIGAGPACDGQVLVINDILGLRAPGFKPKFLREYADLGPIISDAATRYIKDVRSGDYPNEGESFGPHKD